MVIRIKATIITVITVSDDKPDPKDRMLIAIAAISFDLGSIRWITEWPATKAVEKLVKEILPYLARQVYVSGLDYP